MNKPIEKTQKVLMKTSNKSRGGKDVEFRSKKQKNELHILKMSQEWDLRRQQRRLDRQKWVEERRNQKLPIWQRVGNLRVQANEEGILHEAGNQNVNNKEHTENSNEIGKAGVANNHKLEEKVRKTLIESQANEKGDTLHDKSSPGPEFVRLRHSIDQKRDSTGKIQFIKSEQVRTMKQTFVYNVKALETSHVSTAQIRDHGSNIAVKNSSKSPTANDNDNYEEQHYERKIVPEKETKPAPSPKRVDGSVAIQKIPTGEGVRKERKRKLEVGMTDEETRLMPITTTTSSSISHSMVHHIQGDLDTSVKGEKSVPQIKQCYSLLDRGEDENAFFVKTPQSKSTPVAVALTTPVVTTTAPFTAKGQASLPSVTPDPGCLVYLSNSTVQTHLPGVTRHPRSGYLVPVYKTNKREPAYTFLPATSQHSHRARDNLSPEGHLSNRKSDDCVSVGSTSTPMSYPFPHSKPCARETHGACTSAGSKGKVIHPPQSQPSLYRESVSLNARALSSYESSSSSAAVTLTNTSQMDPLYVNGALPGGEGKPHLPNRTHTYTQHHRTGPHVGPLRIIKDERTDSPMASDDKCSAVPSEKFHYPAICRTPDSAPSQTPTTQDAIFNPMSIYVRPRLVPREVVSVGHGSEPSPPLVEYIKTDAICEKELTKWDAKNVRDFIAATDCKDKAELFLEEEIDGKALLSLSPEMLMKGMSLKLGPAVKLYNHIVNLRTALLI
ncbi:polyhomeotic-proximal chromatin protein-like isoform X2 [Stylophora pistillata]|uniref:polyhomeotic-proximal chromatin protein-like isoform X2 n=1 Tax=Stylophora pistillata TaxID=50429 RepID=UPI000C045F0F|nr:polyhomeotic-proximal chromatin protein-like isoform X2 [Stylophora pistillata]